MRRLILGFIFIFLCSLQVNAANEMQGGHAQGASMGGGETAETTITIGERTGVDTYTGLTDSVFINPGSGDTNYDDCVASSTLRIDGNEGVGFVYLDVAGLITQIGSGHTITSAKLFIYMESVDSSPDVNITVHRMLVMPGDSSSTYAFDPTNVTYNERDATADYQWGGDTQANPLADTDYTSSAIFTAVTSTFTASSWEEISSVGLTTLVSNWYSGSNDPYGIVLKCAGDYSRIAFYRHCYTGDTSLRFYWEVKYT